MTELMAAIAAENDAPADVLGLVFSNLAEASRKTLRPNLARLLDAVADSCMVRARQTQDGNGVSDREQWLAELQESLTRQRKQVYDGGLTAATAANDRATLRTFTWGQKVTALQLSLVKKLLESGADVLGEDEQVHVCEACGFTIVKGAVPDICPICKAPPDRFLSL